MTDGATAFELTVMSRVALRRSAWPAVSYAVALARQTPSCGSVTSYDQVALVAPTTSGRPLNVLKIGATRAVGLKVVLVLVTEPVAESVDAVVVGGGAGQRERRARSGCRTGR